MDFSLFDPTLLDRIGVCGFVLYVVNYTLLTLGWVSGDSVQYFAVNLVAAALALIGLSGNFNLASALIQSFFITMSTLGIAIRILRST
jgi:hypothetical protein